MRVATEGGARMMRGAKEPISRLVIFRLVWDFGGRLFDLFLEPLFGAKKSPLFNPQSSTKPTGKLPKQTHTLETSFTKRLKKLFSFYGSSDDGDSGRNSTWSAKSGKS